MNQLLCIIIVRVEFSPLVKVDVNTGHYWPEETTDEGPTPIDAGTGVFLKLPVNSRIKATWYHYIKQINII